MIPRPVSMARWISDLERRLATLERGHHLRHAGVVDGAVKWYDKTKAIRARIGQLDSQFDEDEHGIQVHHETGSLLLHVSHRSVGMPWQVVPFTQAALTSTISSTLAWGSSPAGFLAPPLTAPTKTWCEVYQVVFAPVAQYLKFQIQCRVPGVPGYSFGWGYTLRATSSPSPVNLGQGLADDSQVRAYQSVTTESSAYALNYAVETAVPQELMGQPAILQFWTMKVSGATSAGMGFAVTQNPVLRASQESNYPGL